VKHEPPLQFKSRFGCPILAEPHPARVGYPRYHPTMPRHSTPGPLHPKPKRKSPPHEFFLEALAQLSPEVRPMFSGYAVYIGDKVVCMLR